MAGISYLQTRRGRYYFRRRYPRWLALQIGPGEIVKALPPCAYVDAIDLVRQLTTISDKVLQMAMKVSGLTREDFEDIAREQFSKFQQKFEDAQEKPDGGNPARLAVASQERLRNQEWETGLLAAKKVLSDQGYELDVDDTALREFCRMLLRALGESSRIATTRIGGIYTARPEDPLFQGADKRAQGPSSTKSIPLSTACEKFRDEKIADDSWQYSSIRENKNCHSLILEWFGDRPINKISRIEVSDFLEMLRKLPATRGRSNKMRGHTLNQYVAMTESDPKLKTLSSTTIAKHMRNFGALAEWAVNKGYAVENPVRGVYKLPKNRKPKNEERFAFTDDQLQFWFTSPVYRGCKSENRRHLPGTLIIKDSWYWLPLLWLYHPVRPEEMAQLKVSDCREEDQVIYFDIDGGVSASEVRKAGTKIKTIAARRKLPIHTFLIEIGFVDYVEEQRRAGHVQVFPELKRSTGEKTYGAYICRRFREIILEQGLVGVSAYSFRHNVVTALANGCPNETMRKHLQAHALSGEDSRYIKGFPLADLKIAIDSIRFPHVEELFSK